ncbi:restriction endonuclease subunit S [Candidatus Bipolaricaulota bacterium]|nr:restriction endonuclease subunit S [Candidatus Bipolaricaulota bacterium]
MAMSGRRYNPYPEYKDSGVEWLGEIPVDWEVMRLKALASVQLSNVDKKTVEGQESVRLCNYTDVYYNERITSDFEFMAATATGEQVRRFSLQAGDVLITKDSESWKDIAVAAVVADDMPDVLCGYHLAHIRPANGCAGEFLSRAFAAIGPRDQFHVAANGITRFGLGGDAIRSGVFAVPPGPEQRAITAFLDRETARIDALVVKQQRLIKLLQEKRSALITRAVTKGLDPTVPMQNSGIEWLGEIPAHWEVKPLKRLFANLDHKRVPLSGEERASMAKNYPYYGASGVIDRVEGYIFDEPLILVAEDGANLYSRSTPLAFVATGQYWVNNHAHILRPLDGNVDYWSHVLASIIFDPWITGAAQPKLTGEKLGSIPLPVPPAEERTKTLEMCMLVSSELNSLTDRIFDAITHLKDLRIALITAAVTGKIDVREEVA